MEYVKYDNTDITSDIKQPNDNLLINSDFKSGIINQKGQTSYTCGFNQRLYTIDSWFVNYENSTVTVNTGYINVNLKSKGSKGFGQVVSNINKNNLKYLTAAIKFKDQELKIIKIDTTILNIGVDYFFDIISGFKLGIYFWTDDTNNAWFYIQGNGSFNLEYIKLEEGDQFTGMPIWDKSIELLKCKKYFIAINNIRVALRGYIGQTFAMSFPLPVLMDKTPSVSVVSTSGCYFINTINSWVDLQILQMTWICDNDNMFNFNVTVHLDAYWY